MPLTEAYNEASISDATLQSDIDAEEIKGRRMIRERLEAAGISNFQTAGLSDKIQHSKLFVDAVAGLAIRNAADSQDFMTISAAGVLRFFGIPAVLLRSTSFPNGVINATQTLFFHDEIYDNKGYHDTGVNTDRITVPAGGDGTYLFFVSGSFSGYEANASLYIKKNGVMIPNTQRTIGISGSAVGLQAQLILIHVVDLVAGDYINFEGSVVYTPGPGSGSLSPINLFALKIL